MRPPRAPLGRRTTRAAERAARRRGRKSKTFKLSGPTLRSSEGWGRKSWIQIKTNAKSRRLQKHSSPKPKTIHRNGVAPHGDGGGSKTGGQRSRALPMPIADPNRAAALRSCRTQRGHQFLIDETSMVVGSAPASTPRARLSLAIHYCYRLPWRHPPPRLPAGASCGSTRRILTPFHFSTNFATLPVFVDVGLTNSNGGRPHPDDAVRI